MTVWRPVRFGDLVDFHNRRRVPLSKAVRATRSGPYPYFGAQGIVDRIDDFIFDGEFLLVAEDGENLRSRKAPIARLTTGRFWVNNHAHIVKPKPGLVDENFLLHLLNNMPLAGRVTGAAQPKLTKANLADLEFECPPYELQLRIGAFLSAFDKLIEINERRIELLEDLARSLYREWFVHFRFPGHENVEFADSELGPIPEGWNVYAIGEVAKLRYGKSLTAKTRRPGDIAVVSSAGIIDEHDQMLVEGPGVVIGRKGNVGSVWWVEGPFFPIDTTYYVESDLPLGFLYWLLSGVDFIDSHAAVPGLSREQAMGVRVAIPPIDIVQRFDEANSAMFSDISGCRARSAHLAATRDLLLPRLVTGQLDISDIDLGVLTPAEAE